MSCFNREMKRRTSNDKDPPPFYEEKESSLKANGCQCPKCDFHHSKTVKKSRNAKILSLFVRGVIRGLRWLIVIVCFGFVIWGWYNSGKLVSFR